jgi:hypothetical protein
MIDEMPTLVLVRDHPQDIAHRYAIMSLDGRQVARMKYKDRFELEITAGRHELTGKNELGKVTTIDFSASEGETVTVHIGGVPIGCFSWFAGIFPPTPSIVMKVNEGWGDVGGKNWKV